VITLAELAELVGGRVFGDGGTNIRTMNTPDRAVAGDLVFATDDRWLAAAEASQASAILTSVDAGAGKPKLVVVDVRQATQQLLGVFARTYHPEIGIHPLAFVSPTATLASDVAVGPFACILDSAVLGSGVVVHPFVYVGDGCTIGNDTVLFPGAKLMPHSVVGSRCNLHAGCVIGEAGFGYVPDGGQHRRIPQIGHVAIGDDVDVGANTTIDRAMVGATIVGDGTKIDNLVQIGHNVRIGSNCIIVAQVAIGGSAKIGDNVVLGGQTGVAEHLEIAAGVRTGGGTGVARSLRNPGDYWGFPARPMKDTLAAMAATNRAPKMAQEVAELRRRLEELEKRLG
jgi:UDP-3-O-[3-hydroxymyristoyl] glucosamine N-acyltransferase